MAVTQHFLELSFKKSSIKKNINRKNPQTQKKVYSECLLRLGDMQVFEMLCV